MIEKGRMHGFTDDIVAAKGERNIADPPADFAAWKIGLDPARRLDEVHRIVVVLLDAGGHGENIRIKDDVLRRYVDLFGQELIGTPTNFYLARKVISLATLIER